VLPWTIWSWLGVRLDINVRQTRERLDINVRRDGSPNLATKKCRAGGMTPG